MSDAWRKFAGAPRSASRAEVAAAWAQTAVPLAAPFLILACGFRGEVLKAAAAWSVLILPGALAVNALYAAGHPFSRSVARLSVASVLGLVPFGVVAWMGCVRHWTLSTVLIIWAVLYFASTALLIIHLVRRQPAENAPPDDAAAGPTHPLGGSRWAAVTAIAGVIVVLVGVWLALSQTRAQPGQPRPESARAYWGQGTALGTAGSVIAGVGFLWGVRSDRSRRQPTVPKSTRGAPTKGTRRKASARPRPERGPSPESAGRRLVIFPWLGVAALTLLLMKVSYNRPPSDFPRPEWNSDDVTYVSEAVDYRYGLPMGKFESSIGSECRLRRPNMSPFVAPLVATISRATGVDCAALHHSVLRPLIMLLGVSALGAALLVVFRGDRWAVPLGLLVALLVICKSWNYERSIVELTVFRAMQTKSIHLLWIHPLQLATLIAVVVRPNVRHLVPALAVAIVGHLVHPFATVLGAVWVGVVLVAALLRDRRAVPMILILLLAYGGLGFTYRQLSRFPKSHEVVSTGREPTEPEQSRDLVRVDDQPIMRQEPWILFGLNTLFTFSVCAIPVAFALGWRQREVFYVAAISLVATGLCNVTALGNLLNRILPTSILYRARWLVPSLAAIAVLALVLYWALCVLIRRRDAAPSAVRSLLATLVVVAAFAGMLSQTSAYAVTRPGPASRQLSKFSDDVHGLVDLLGGVKAAPFVWGPREVTRELPQLMPNIKLVLSRRKLMRPADDPEFRNIVLGVRELFRTGQVQPAHFRRLLALYPIDHVVLDYGGGAGRQPAQMLQAEGWQRVGRSGRYEVWRIERTP